MAGTTSTTPPGLPLKVRILIAAHSFASSASRRSDGTINRALMDLFDPKAPPSSKPVNGVASSDVTVDAARKLWFRLFDPSSSSALHSPLPLLIYFHGGGFALNAANSKAFDALCRRLAGELPAVVLSVNYRRSPEHRFPSPYEDGVDALKFIDNPQNGTVLPPSTDPNRCFISGDSAGGNIAHHVALRAGEQEFKNLKVIGLICIQPFFGGEERTESELRLAGAPLVSSERAAWMWKGFLPEGSDRDHEAANFLKTEISAANFPATLLFVGGYDPLQDWQKRYHQWLKKCGKEVELVEYPNAFHGFYAFPELPESSMFITEMKHFIPKLQSI